MEGEMPASPMVMIERTLGTPLNAGELGVIMARAGAGKTACLSHIALEHLLLGQRVLHVSIGDVADKIKIWYQELLKNVVAAQPGKDLMAVQSAVEPLRSILAYLYQTFSPAKLEKSLQDLRDQAKFNPSVVILDGLDLEQTARSTIEALKDFARRQSVAVWMSARTHRHITISNERGIPFPCHESDDLFEAIISLEPSTDHIRVKVLKHGDRYQPDHPEVLLNAQTYLVQTA